MHPTQRSGSSPTSQLDYRGPQPQPANRSGVGSVQPQPQEPAASEPQDVPFPGLVVHVTFPLINSHEDYPVGTAVPDQHGEMTANCATSGTAMTSSTLDVDSDKNPHKLPPLISAVTNGQLSEVFGLLAKAEMDIDQVCEKRGWSALMYAANEAQFDLVAALLDAGADVNFSDIKNGKTALMLACARGHVKVVQLLLKQTKILIDKSNPKGETALMIAAWTNTPNIVRLLLDAGANANTSILASGDTALSIASEEGHIDVVRVLLSQPRVDLHNSRYSPLMIAARDGHVDIVELLLQHGDIDLTHASKGLSPLMLAAENNKLDVVIRLVDAMTKNYRHVIWGGAALMRASMNGHSKIVDLLLNKGVDPNETSGGNSALLVAVDYGQSAVVRRLIESNADVNLSRGDLRDTALMLASESGRLKVVKLLITHINIELDKADNDGKSALMRAASSNHPAVVECLLDAGASTGRIGRAGINALRHMLNAGYPAIVEVLLQKNVKIDDGVFDFFPKVATPFDTAVADLCAERTAVAFVLPKPEEAENFFKELIETLGEEATGQPMLKWLRHKGIRMACARQVLAALSGAHAPWKKEGASEQQKMNYCLSALSKLNLLGGDGRILAPYRQAKTSPAARVRLGKVATEQLEDLYALATDTLARIGARMGGALIACCMAATRIHNKVDVVALKASLLDQGYCGPVADAIVQSWRATIKKLVSSMTMPADTNIKPDEIFKRTAATFKMHVVQHAPVLFVQELLERLNSRDLLTQLQFLLGEINDDAVHEQLQIQCDQLRQFCAQLPGSPTSTSNTADTSNTTSTASTSSPPKQ